MEKRAVFPTPAFGDVTQPTSEESSLLHGPSWAKEFPPQDAGVVSHRRQQQGITRCLWQCLPTPGCLRVMVTVWLIVSLLSGIASLLGLLGMPFALPAVAAGWMSVLAACLYVWSCGKADMVAKAVCGIAWWSFILDMMGIGWGIILYALVYGRVCTEEEREEAAKRPSDYNCNEIDDLYLWARLLFIPLIVHAPLTLWVAIAMRRVGHMSVVDQQTNPLNLGTTA